MKTLCFILTMPGNNSWNGKWSGEGTYYAVLRKVSSKSADSILSVRFFSYNFGDGWRAEVEACHIEGDDIRKARKQSKGFCGYDWMVDSIIQRGCIKASHQLKEEAI